MTKTAEITNPTKGECEVSFHRVDTLSLEARSYCFDISRTNEGTDSSLVIGYLHLRPRAR